MNLCWTKTR